MAVKTTLEQLEEVQTAITAVMTGQSYSLGGRTLTRADLKALGERESMLLNRYRAEQATGSNINKVQFQRPV